VRPRPAATPARTAHPIDILTARPITRAGPRMTDKRLIAPQAFNYALTWPNSAVNTPHPPVPQRGYAQNFWNGA
jgi:hypothetical protein